MANNVLETGNVSARYDAEAGILYVTYRGILTPSVTQTYYRWLGQLIANSKREDLMKARGSIYDFRQVKQFIASNISTAQRQSQEMNRQVDMSHIPVALITETTLQTEWVRVTMKITPEQARKRIVKTVEEAFAFFDAFHAKRMTEAADKPGETQS